MADVGRIRSDGASDGGRQRARSEADADDDDGVPDVYKGTEIVDLSLVDPDNRRPVDYRAAGSWDVAGVERNDARKLLVKSTALRSVGTDPLVWK